MLYVTALVAAAPSRRWPHDAWAWLGADSVETLRAYADAVYLPAAWGTRLAGMPVYRVERDRWVGAVRRGAILLSEDGFRQKMREAGRQRRSHG